MSSLAILVPVEGKPSFVKIGDYTDLNKHVECRCGTTVYHPGNRDCYAWVDDEGLLVNKPLNLILSTIMEYPGPLVGNGVICGVDDDGENVDVDSDIIELVESVTNEDLAFSCEEDKNV